MKNFKKLNEELEFITWYPRIWWIFCKAGAEKKDVEPIFTE